MSDDAARLPSDEPYPPIRDYALIGDCHGAALVDRHGRVGWLCLERFDATPILFPALDHEIGGCFEAIPVTEYTASRRYLDRTNILETTFETATGRAKVVDFMPVGRVHGSSTHDYVSLTAPGWLIRQFEGLEGEVTFRVRYRPTRNWGRETIELERGDGVVSFVGGPCLYSDDNFALDGNEAGGELTVQAGEFDRLIITPRWLGPGPAALHVDKLLDTTRAFWTEWSEYCHYDGPYAAEVLRSALTLKMMTFAPSGAIVAAPTTSLPEMIGAERNWDYRFCWLRDATFSLFALSALGYSGEARRFFEYLMEAHQKTYPLVQIMYGLDGEAELEESLLEHLHGYRGSRPVRTGNDAYRQRQLDVYGEVLDAALLQTRLGAKLTDDNIEMLRHVCEFVVDRWREPGHGLWEMRTDPQQFVYGKIMCWVALDRSRKLFKQQNDDAIQRAESEILDAIRKHGVDPETGALQQSFDSTHVDASLLRTPHLGFPLESETLEGTVRRIQERLCTGDFIHRYLREDGLEGEEGAFLMCSFWMVEALLHLDRPDEARAMFERLLGHANDVGLYAEMIEPDTGAFLGNFPQAFTHVALIGAAISLSLYESGGVEALRGSHADRVKRRVGATEGWRGVLSTMRSTGRIGRVHSSKESMLSDKYERSVGRVRPDTQQSDA